MGRDHMAARSKVRANNHESPDDLRDNQRALGQDIEGHGGPKTLETGATYACHVGMVETNENKGAEVAVMRIIRLMPPE